MTAPVPSPALQLIREVVPRHRDGIPVSLALAPDGSTIVVSRFRDNTWDFRSYIPQESRSLSHKRINWRVSLPNGHDLTDKEHAGLLYSAKAFVWSLFAAPVDGRRRPTMSTLITRQKVLLFLLRWMVQRGLATFSDVTGHTLDYAEAARSNNGTPVSLITIEKRLRILEDIYQQRAKLDDALQIHPWPGESIATLAGSQSDGQRYIPKTKPIPDRVATELARNALDYIRNRGPSAIAARDAKDGAIQEKKDAGFGHDTIKRTRAKIVREWGYENAYKLGTDLNQLRTACYIVISLFSGLRQSEVMSLSEGCITRGRSWDESCELTWLRGTIYKMGVRAKTWLVPPVVEEAVAVVTQLTAPLRESLRQEVCDLEERIPLAVDPERSHLIRRLTIAKRHQDKLFLSKHSKQRNAISVLSGASIYSNLRQFCADHSILADDGDPYPLHSHQFRRSYARFIAKAELGDLLTLREHFGHWSLDMTTYYAEGASQEFLVDRDLLNMVYTEKQYRQKEIVGELLEDDGPLANGGHWLGKWREAVRTAPSKEALIAEYAGSITLNGTGHSWCVGNAKNTGCGGLCVFEAQMCVECPHGIIGPEHRAVWKGIRNQQLEVLALDDVGDSGRARAQHIKEIAERVLQRLDGEDVP